ncbi:MAG: PAS domain S-box protein [Syntrophomonadaceae bacterium]|nr:PAS domain S-box protein [Syntrophomonadaceae bacterium]
MKKETSLQAEIYGELESLRHADNINHLILENISDLVAIHRLSDLRYEYVNSATLKALGYTREELFAQSPLELVHPDDMERVFTRMKDNLPQGVSRDKFRYRRKDGTYAWLKVQGTILPGDGQVPFLILICQDISAEKKLEESLLEAYNEMGRIAQHYSVHGDPGRQAFKWSEMKRQVPPAVNRTEEVLDLALITTEGLNEEHLLNSCCQLIVEKPGFSLAWVGYVLEGPPQKVKPVAYAGLNSGYLAKLNIVLQDPKRGNGPTGQAIRSGQPVVMSNLKTDDAFAPWVKDALRRGFKSSMSIPLQDSNGIFGSLNVYSEQVDGFDAEQQQFLVKISNKLARTLVSLRK